MVAGLLGAGGCADRAGGSDVQVRSEIRRPEPPPPLSPAQRDRGFRRFFSEGVRLAGARRFGPASAAFEAAVRLKPDSAEALFNLGACYEELGDPMRAVHLYRRVLGLTPDDPACYFNLGTSYIKMYHRDQSPGWRKMARDAWRRSLELNPDQPEVERFLARTEGLE